MTNAADAGFRNTLIKIARSGMSPRSIAGFMHEGGSLTPGLISKFRISPGEMNKARKIKRKMGRKDAFRAETTRRSASRIVGPSAPPEIATVAARPRPVS